MWGSEILIWNPVNPLELVLQRSAKDVHHETDAGREFLLKSSDCRWPLGGSDEPVNQRLFDSQTESNRVNLETFSLSLVQGMRGFGLWLFDSNTLLWSVRSYVIWCYSLLPSANTFAILFAHSRVEFLRSGKWSTLRATQRALQQPRGRMHRGSLDDSTSHVALKLCQDETWKMEPLVWNPCCQPFISFSQVFSGNIPSTTNKTDTPTVDPAKHWLFLGLVLEITFGEDKLHGTPILNSSTKPGVHCMCVRCQDLLQSVCFNRALLRCHARSTALARTSGQLRRPNWPKYLGREWYLDANVQCECNLDIEPQKTTKVGTSQELPAPLMVLGAKTSFSAHPPWKEPDMIKITPSSSPWAPPTIRSLFSPWSSSLSPIGIVILIRLIQ